MRRNVQHSLLLAGLGLALAGPALAAEPTPAEAGDVAIQKLFEESTRQVLPLDPSQIREFRGKLKQTEEALYDTPPEISNRTIRLALDPGAEAPKVRLAPGYVSTFALFDATGAPWPISSLTQPGGSADSKPFDVTRVEVGEKNIITVSPLSRSAHGNVVLILEGHPMPVTIRLQTTEAASSASDSIAFQANRRGPLAAAPEIGKPPVSAVDKIQLAFLDGVPVSGARELSLVPDLKDVAVWEYQGKYYLRTPHPAVWPAWTSVATGVDGTRVYEMPPVPSIMVSANGVTQSLTVEDTRVSSR